MKIKSFWNRGPKALSPAQIEIEKKLLPRLFLMGYIFILLSLSSFVFVMLLDSEPVDQTLKESAIETPILTDEALDEMELQATEVLNFYVISLIFASLAGTCFYLGKIKKRELYQEVPLGEEIVEESPSIDP